MRNPLRVLPRSIPNEILRFTLVGGAATRYVTRLEPKQTHPGNLEEVAYVLG